MLAERAINSLRSDSDVVKPDKGTRLDPFRIQAIGKVYSKVDFDIVPTVLSVARSCKSAKWQWQTRVFTWTNSRSDAVPIRFQRLGYPARTSGFFVVPVARQGDLPAGDLVGLDRGEFGGGFSWHPRGGKPELLYGTNTSNVERTSDSAIAAFSEGVGFDTLEVRESGNDSIVLPDGTEIEETILFSNYPGRDGFAVHFTRDASGKWQMKEAARFIQGNTSIRTIGPDLYAAWSAGRVIVFDTQRILGLADCIATN